MKKNLTKRGWCILPLILFLMAALAGGCEKKETADDYLGRYITKAKESEGGLTGVLEDGIAQAKSDESLVVDFPEELKKPYEAFLREALKQVKFELNKADKESDDSYLVRVTYEPLDLATLTESVNEEHVGMIASADLSAEVKALLEKDTKLLSTGKKQAKKSQTIKVQKKGNGFSIKEEDVKGLLKDALPGYMDPYKAVASVFDMRDFILSYLDASYKGETERYQLHTQKTPEEAAAWYEETFSGFKMDEFSDDQNARLVNAAKEIFKKCQYSLGTIKKISQTEYEVELISTPNISFQKIAEELSAGSYSSQAEVNEAFLSKYDAYAANPAYGEQQTVSIIWNTLNMMDENTDDAEFNKIVTAIIPAE